MKNFFFKLRSVLTDKHGEGYIDTGIKIIISVVIGTLILGGLYSIFNEVILPGLADRMQGMFN